MKGAGPIERRRRWPARGAHRLVLLDRDVWARALAEGALRARDCRVFSTGEPETAVRIAREMMVDLLLADISMSVLEAVPRMERRRIDPAPAQPLPLVAEGYALLRPLEVDPTGAQYPMVALKQAGLSPDAESARFGFVDCARKPFTPQALAQKVDDVLRRVAATSVSLAPAPEGLAGPVVPVPASYSPGSADAELMPVLHLEPDSLAPWVFSAPVFESIAKSQRTALVVDEDARFRRLLHGLLRGQAFTVFEAGTGAEALEVALARSPRLILTEVNMGGMDGFEFCARIRAHGATRSTPLIFLSGWDDYWERHYGLMLGADDYLPKLTPVRELLIRIQLAMQQRSQPIGLGTDGAGLEGDLEVMGVIGVLQACHLSELTGVLSVRCAPDRAVKLRFHNGELTGAESSDGLRGPDAVFDLISWSQGRFRFVPGDPGAASRLDQTFEQLLLEGCRRLDETRRLLSRPGGGWAGRHDEQRGT